MNLYIKQNIVSLSSLLLTIIVCYIYFVKPKIIFNNDGTYKYFGLGKKSKTMFPIWLCILILAILCYTFLRFLIIIPRLK